MILFVKTKPTLFSAAFLLSITGVSCAQEITAETDCSKYAPTKYGGDIECKFKQAEIFKRQGAELDKRSAKLNKEIRANEDATACINAVRSEIASAKVRGPLSPEQKSSFKAQIERCDRN